jgi:phosphohistidine phosphatase
MLLRNRNRRAKRSFVAEPTMSTKTLLLLRHAKSSWEDPQLDDHERPLNSRGRRVAPLMGQRLREEQLEPDFVFCSTAVRTRETAALVFAEQTTSRRISYHAELYHAEPAQISRFLNHVDASLQRILIIGHNPGLEDLLATLTGKTVSFPTASLAHVDLNLKSWSQFNSETRGRLAQIWRPREIGAH